MEISQHRKNIPENIQYVSIEQLLAPLDWTNILMIFFSIVAVILIVTKSHTSVSESLSITLEKIERIITTHYYSCGNDMEERLRRNVKDGYKWWCK